MKKEIKKYSGYTDLKLEEIDSYVTGWLKNDDGNRVRGMQVQAIATTHHPDDKTDEVMSCDLYLLEKAQGYIIDETDCITDM